MQNDYSGSYRKPERTMEIRGTKIPVWYEVVYRPLGGEDEVERGYLVPISLEGEEGVGTTFRYDVLCRVDLRTRGLGMPELDLKELRRSAATVSIDVPGKGEFIPGMKGRTGQGHRGHCVREISGQITSAEFVREEERAKVYRFVIEPPFANAKLGKGYQIFQNRTVLSVVEEIIGRYMSYELQIGGPQFIDHYPRRDLIRQHFESDYNFVSRLCEENGQYWFFTHSNGVCRLVLTDTPGGFKKHGEATATLLYSTENRIDEEHIDRLELARRVAVDRARAVDHDYQRPRLGNNVRPVREKYESPESTGHGKLEHYDYANSSQPLQGAMGLNGKPNELDEETRERAMVRMEALRAVSHRARGHGFIRSMLAGHTFTLEGYPLEVANDLYVVIKVKLSIVEVAQSSGTKQAFRCESDFEIQPWGVPYRLPLVTPRPLVVAERAIVTGPKDRRIWTDAQGRVLVQTVPDREGTYDENSFIWVAPMQGWQGSQFGITAVPRIGSEVILGYINGNPDMPVLMGSVPNAHKMPGFALPHNQWVTGIRSQVEEGFDSAHIVVDDTKGRQQAQIASDHKKSSLSVGYNTRIDGNKGRQDARGEGYELRTDGHGTHRAAEGMFLTTDSRPNAEGTVKENAETVARLTRARELHEQMGDVAHKNGAQDTTGDQLDITRSMKQENAELRGSGKPGDGAFPEFEKPDITLSSRANLQAAAEGSIHHASGTHSAFTAGGNFSFASAKSFLASAFDKVSLYAHKGRVFIGSTFGKVRIHAQKNTLDMIGNGNVTVMSEEGVIYVLGKERIVLRAGGSEVVIDASGVIARTPGQVLLHGADHATTGPMTAPSHFAVVAPFPMSISCAALNAAESTDTGIAQSVAAPTVGASPAPAPAPAVSSASAMKSADSAPSAAGQSGGTPLATSPATQTSAAQPGGSGPDTTTPAHGETEPCRIELHDIPVSEVTWDMESADYWGLLADGTKYLDQNGNQIFVQMGGSFGKFDIGFDTAKKTITMKVIVLVKPKKLTFLGQGVGAVPQEEPYESARDNDSNFAAKYVKSDRPVSDVKNLGNMKQTIEKFLNGNSYKLTIKNCPFSSQGDSCTNVAPSGQSPVWKSACAQQIDVKFEIDFITDENGRHHAEVNLYPMAIRADSGNWGERNVIFDSRSRTWTDNPIEHVQSHETGHLFSFPDEYFDAGGAIHKSYVIQPDKKINLQLAKHNPNTNMWQGVGLTTLMGPGVYRANAKVPSHYLQRAADWFVRQTGKSWVVTPHIEA